MASYQLDIENADKHLSIERLHLGDNGIRTLDFYFQRSGKHLDIPDGCTATLYAVLPDKSVIYDSCEIFGDCVKYTVTGGTDHPSLTSMEGESLCEIRLTFADGKTLTSPSFSVFCDGVLQDDGAIEASESFSALTDALARAEACESGYMATFNTFVFDETRGHDDANLSAFQRIFEKHESKEGFNTYIRYSSTGDSILPAEVYFEGRDYSIVSALGPDVKTAYLIIYAHGEITYKKQTLSLSGDGNGSGESGATFIPSVSKEGILSWTNDKGLANPAPVSIKGTDGKSAYAYAKDGGYTGTEAEFAEMLNSLSDVEYIDSVGWGALKTYSGYINGSGNFTEHVNYITSDFIEVVPDTDIVYSNLRGINRQSYVISAYDEDKAFVSQSSVYVDDTGASGGTGIYLSGTYSIPVGVAYVRIMDWKDKTGSFTYVKKIEKSADENALDGTQWRGKKLFAFGTSITDTTYTNTETGEVTGKYLPFLAEMSGLEVTDYGIAGGTIATGGLHNASGNILTKILATDVSGADLITIEGFVNDFACAVSLGEVTDTENTTLCGAIYQAVKYCLEKSSATVVLITDSTGKKYTMSSTGNEADYTVSKLNSLDLKQVDYNNAIIKMGQYMGVPVIDAGGNSHINCFRPSYIIDQIHHTTEGGKQYATAIWSELKSIGLSQTSVPVDKEPEVKALWDMADRTELTAEEAGVTITTSTPTHTIAGTTARSISYDKYIRGCTSNGNWQFGEAYQPIISNIGKDSFTMEIIAAQVGLGMPMDLEVNKSYKLTYTVDATHRIYATYFNESGVYQKATAIQGSDTAAGTYTKTFTAENYAYCQITFRGPVRTYNYSGIMLEEA
ncbi:MAG: SGNH/GDSL hydrolase family protein [Clostridia bacterium]|nr:SGNH/GDSL hydrolase family protein [Clostridia bacterium]